MSPQAPPPPGAWLVKGEDPSLVSEKVREVLDRLLGGEDPSLAAVFLDPDSSLQAISDALGTPPLFSERRVVVVRQAGGLGPEAAELLTSWCKAPSPFAHLVVAAGGGALSQKLASALSRAGEVLDASHPRGAARQGWFAEVTRAAPVRLEPAAAAALRDHLGADLGRLHRLLEALASAYGEGARITAEQLHPYLGSHGDVSPWELTDAVEAGEMAKAMGALRWMLSNGRHPLAVLALLVRNFSAALAMEGREDLSEAEAASELRMAPFAARKALALARRLGRDRLFEATAVLAGADLDLRGRSGLPAELVMEITVARLARICSTPGSQRRGRRRA